MTCVFCNIIDDQLPAARLFEDDQLIAIRDLSPQAPTHILIIPKQHLATLNELQDQHAALLGHMMLTAQRLAKQEGIEHSGYRLVLNTLLDAGQTVFHIHLHLLGGRALTWPPG